tara:strand:- start:279 stop:785 length:507 start_codon:yes stop_codon:yes gene_type:complete
MELLNFNGPYCYTLFLSGEETKRVLKKKVCNGKVTNFTKPVTLTKTPKIYILKHKDEIVYVGYASQPIGLRIGQGMRAKGLYGYHGYKWRNVDKLELLVFVAEKTLIGNRAKADLPFIAYAEAVEAELVFLVRDKTGKWPEFQNEIHFNNAKLEKAKKEAQRIYKLLN